MLIIEFDFQRKYKVSSCWRIMCFCHWLQNLVVEPLKKRCVSFVAATGINLRFLGYISCLGTFHYPVSLNVCLCVWSDASGVWRNFQYTSSKYVTAIYVIYDIFLFFHTKETTNILLIWNIDVLIFFIRSSKN